MKIVASALHFAWKDVADCIRIATQELGLDGVEFSFHPSYQRGHCTLEDLNDLAGRLQSEPHLSAHIWTNLAAKDSDDVCREIERWIEVARKSGIKELVCHGGAAEDRLAGIANARRVLVRMEPICAAYGLFLNVENHYPYEYRSCREVFSDSWEFMHLFAGLGEHVGFCFDTGHANMAGNLSLLISTLRPWLRYVHIADNNGADDEHLPYGHGTVNWAGFWSALLAPGFDGTVCFEFPIKTDDEAWRKCRADMLQFAAGRLPYDMSD